MRAARAHAAQLAAELDSAWRAAATASAERDEALRAAAAASAAVHAGRAQAHAASAERDSAAAHAAGLRLELDRVGNALRAGAAAVERAGESEAPRSSRAHAPTALVWPNAAIVGPGSSGGGMGRSPRGAHTLGGNGSGTQPADRAELGVPRSQLDEMSARFAALQAVGTGAVADGGARARAACALDCVGAHASLCQLSLVGCNALKCLSLAGSTTLVDVNVRSCGALRALAVDGCLALRTLTACNCPELALVAVSRCAALDALDVRHCRVGAELQLGDLAKARRVLRM